MKNKVRFSISLLVLLMMSIISTHADEPRAIRLLVRADDIGSSHAANRACIDAYNQGIARSVEIMVNCAWFPEAVRMLNEVPEYDVGVHLMLTSEWDYLKWRPLTHAPSIVDENGFFFPMVWPNDNYPPERTIRGANWDIDEIEMELRAQIELAMKHLPHITHITTHMGFRSMDHSVDLLLNRLAKEYNIFVDLSAHGFQRMPGWRRGQSLEEKIDTFIANLKDLEPGNYLFVEHPAYDEPEMRATFHNGYMDVAQDREEVTQIFTSKKVMQVIDELGIELVSYRDFK